MNKLLTMLVLCASIAYGQFGTAARIRSGASLPGTCAVGDVFYKTAATAGQYVGQGSPCVWTLQPGLDANGNFTIGTRVLPATGGAVADIIGPVTTTFSATPTFTCPPSANAVVEFGLSTALTANITSSTLASCATGAVLSFRMCQDGTGGRTVAWPTGFTEAVAPSPIASSCTKELFYWDGAAARLLSATVDGGPGVIVTQSAPAGNPPAGSIFEWWDSTDYTLKTKDQNGVVYAQTKAVASRVANQFVTHIPTTGIQATAAIAAADLPGTLTSGTAITNASLTTPALGTPSALVLTNATGLPAAQVPPTPVSIAATTHEMVAPREYFFCTTATECSVTLPVPAAGYEFCVRSDSNVSTAITLAARTNIYYSKPNRTGWGSSGGTLVSGAAVTNQICVLGYNATHYAVMSYVGTWTAN